MEKKWFYVRVDLEGVPEFLNSKSMMKTNTWSHWLSPAVEAEAAPLLAKIGELLSSVTGVHLIATFVKM